MINPSKTVIGRFIPICNLPDHMIPIPEVTDYYWDPEGDRVISMKSSKGPYQMKRNEVWDSPGNPDSYYSLTLGPGQGHRVYLLSELRKLTFNQPEIKKEENMKQERYIVGSIEKVALNWSITNHPRTHESLTAARTEAERLAKIETHKKFVVLKVEGVVAIADVIWE